MDNPLTPKKILRLMHLAEDKSFSFNRRVLTSEDVESCNTQCQSTFNQTGTNCESSGIIDLERVDGFGESGLGSISGKSNTFNPGEMTGRSTEAIDRAVPEVATSKTFDEYGRHSMALDNITRNMDKQTSEIQDMMRHSIATNYSFHTKRDLTADEESLVLREAPLPVQHSTQVNFQDSTMLTGSNVSAYFKNRCPEFGKILGKTDSPDRPSITEISAYGLLDHTQHNIYKMDQTLDCVPVRQPRIEKALEKSIVTSLFPNKVDVPTYTVPKTMNVDMIPHNINKITLPMSSNAMEIKTMNQNTSQKSYMYSSKPTDILLRNLQTSLHLVPDDTACSVENSLSISRIADYLGKESNVSISDMLQLNNQMKPLNKKQPLTELHLNVLENKDVNKELYVTNLKDTQKADTATSSSTLNTIITLDKLKVNEKHVPSVVISQYDIDTQNSDVEERSLRPVQSNSPSGKSHSTLSTVQENIASFKFGDSPVRYSKGEAYASCISSPNTKYRELDKSVDWDEVFKQKRFSQEGLAKEQWAEITTSPVEGFVGVSVAVTISVTTLTDNWLTAKFEFDNLPNDGKDMTIELPRFPILLSPAKTEKFTLYITSNVEMSRCLPYTMYLKDASLDCDVEYKGSVEVNIKMPVIQALSSDGVNKLHFPTIQERSSVTKHFVVISDCPVDLQLELSIPIGESMFVIKSVQEIKKTDVSKVLMDRSPVEDGQVKAKKVINKQLCRLSNGNAIKVAVTFHSPKLSDLELSDRMPTFNGTLYINLIGINTVMKTINLIASVGCASLVVQPPVGKLVLTNEPTILNLRNAGTIIGVWAVKFKSKTATDGHFPFKVSANRIEISPGGVNQLKLVYFGPVDTLNEGTLILEDIANGSIASIDIVGGSDKPKSFPIKTNYNNISWVRAGRKELSLKNSTDQKIHIRCQMLGDGFMLDCPGAESRGTYVLAFGPCECRPLPIIFAPNSCLPHTAALHLVYDKNSDYSRKIKLHGCASNDSVRWSGLMTYGDTALVRAVSCSDIELKLFNKAAAPAFLCARVQFNLQYRFISSESELVGGRHVVGRRSQHTVALRLPWARLVRRARASDATALATVSVLTGPEFTRRRIIRILKNEPNGVMDLSLLPDHLKVLVEPFEGEDETMDTYLQDFSETKTSLNELIEGLQELTAQIDLPHDFADDNTILITDDTVVVHRTLCD